MNKAVKIIAVFATIMTVSLIIALSSMGFIIKKTINSVGPNIAGTDVSLGGSQLSLLTGKAGMDSLLVANPKGFKHPNAFQFNRAQIKLQPGSFFGDNVIINEISIDGMELSWEGLNGDNIKQIQANITAFSAKEKAREQEAEELGGAEKTKGLVLHKILITNIKIKPVIFGFSADLIIPEIKLEHIGTSDEPSSLVVLIDQVVAAINTSSDQLIQSTYNQLADDIKKQIKKHEADIKKQQKELEQSGKDVLSGEKSIDSAINDLKSIKLK